MAGNSEADDIWVPGVVDLFGERVPRSRGRKGRPPHSPTEENRKFVQLALACGRGEAEIAAGLRINERTLKRHYFHELAGKASARMRLEMRALARLVEQVEAGKPAAIKQFLARLDKIGLHELSERVASRGSAERAPPKLGKKEERKLAAGKVTGRFAPRQPPGLLN